MLRRAGRSYAAIAARLNEGEIPTVGGGRRWYAVLNAGDNAFG
jgi:hypothetical protein